MWTGNSTYEPFEDPLHLLLDIFQAAVRIQDTVYDQVCKSIVNQFDEWRIFMRLLVESRNNCFARCKAYQVNKS
jgi:hypothetical protein